MLILLAGSDQRYCRRLGELLHRDGHRIVIGASSDGCNLFLERSKADLIMLGIGTDEVPTGLLRPIAGTAFVVLTEPGAHNALDLPADVSCIERPEDPQVLRETLATLFEPPLTDEDGQPA